jgi:transposase
VQEQLGQVARGGALFVFFGKRKTAIKVLFHDGSGMCIFYKRADRSTFRIPEPPRDGAASVELSERELDDLLDGIATEVAVPRSRRTRVH